MPRRRGLWEMTFLIVVIQKVAESRREVLV
jgi:hypothetical protein